MDFAYVTLTLSEEAHCRIDFNDFPLLDEVRAPRMQWMDILNMKMFPDNRLEIVISPTEPQTAIKADLRLSRHAPGSIVSPKTGRPLEAGITDATGTPRPQAPDGTVTLSGTGQIRAQARFGSFGPDFSARLRPDRALDPARAIATAETILAEMAAGETDAVIARMAPFTADAAQVWNEAPSRMLPVLRENLDRMRNGAKPGPDGYDLSAEQIGPLVRVLRDGGPLLRTRNGKLTQHVVLGWSDGQVAILR